ncbi:H-NS histone family protein [Halomonas sp. QX-2]|uniref:H-NS histone family protein n=1 Tax=Vreelandella sedimenti TaxID=2729618 RepID=A0A7Z0N7B9_9GAMM|nr:histone-like nucleoid-structuring protein, MvaT/MvaU family [Halomonas sedimenti]NYT72975.1 H-NS histone family protein [Halomonas sedimenti]|tara:strand:+ start:2897 stop:3271 length:375 start_codon:yes stop_codon:yes gene_type:complete
MTSVLKDYIQKEQLLKKLQEELQELENNSELKEEIEFKERLQALMTEYGKLAREVCEMIDPSYNRQSTKKSGMDGRKKRPLKVYKNPHTEEVVETRGGNHKIIQAWKAEFGNEEVGSWVIDESA